MDEQLKPCPFCGSTTESWYFVPYEGVAHYLRCTKCGAEGPPAKTPEEAVRKWNKRA